MPNSTGCPSSILEDPSSSTTQPPPILQLNPKIQHFTAEDEDAHFLSGGDLNGFICSLFEDPQTQELAYNYYEKAKQNPDYEFLPKKSTLNYLIRLVSCCVRARKFKLAHTLLQVFKTDNEIATLAFDSAMKGYNKLHMYSSTIDLYGLMKSSGIVLDFGCYSRVMEAYMKTGDFDRVVSLFEQLETRSSTAIIDSTSSPTPIFREIYGILCESLGKSGRAFEALEFFRDMKKKGIPEDHSIYSSLICSFARIREVQIAEELLMEAESNKMLRDPAVFLKVVLMYVEEGLLEKTKEIVAAMKRVKIRVSDCIFCAIVNGFSKRRGLRAALEVYEDMILEGCEPGQVTYASIINVYYRLGLYLKAEKAFSEMENKGFDRCIVAYSNMVAMYGKAGKLRDAMRLVAKMKERGCEPNVWIYNSLLDMHGRLLKLRQVEKIWKEMKRRKIVADKDMKTEGTQLDGRLYRSALNALRDAGLQVQAKWLQQSFGTM
ncbi:Pentatricopeptide repeat-containing protein [Camellia lanceoleosa]|uniref:Pentatricopeptide repeat-containing protein n=1 Tax=Camellia lanceoleosa TaxID=1840588 RepID=A0ACC0IBK9_9ERIC|nr:Pentatricopeptide repeat-containing protein [Camellia lanceoleosa]